MVGKIRMKNKRQQPERNREVLYGINPIAEALRAGKRKFSRIIINKGSKMSGGLGKIADTASRKRIQVDYETRDVVAKLAGAEGSQGIVALVTPPVFIGLEKLMESSLKSDHPALCVLDGVNDPRNFGAIIRSAEAFGIDGIIFPSRRAVGYTPVAAKASAGAGELTQLCRVTNIAETVRELRDNGYECIAFDGDASEIFQNHNPTIPIALVFGGEGSGVRPLVEKRCNQTVRIPIKGNVGSLNVSSAASIAFYIATNS